MTDDDIKKLRALCEKATEGPWRQHPDFPLTVDDGCVMAGCTMTFDCEYEPDAAFIAAARSALPAALDEVDRLRADNARLRALVEEAFREGWEEGFDVGGSGTLMNPEDEDQRDADWLESNAKEALR